MLDNNNTIVAPATGNILSALGIIRLSGNKAISIVDKVFVPVSKQSFKTIAKANRLYFGTIQNKDEIIDQVVVSCFLKPHSFTGEDTIEISFHGSTYIEKTILQLLIDNGAVMAQRGEFTMRAFVNGKINLSQAEAINDLIHSNTKANHNLAIKQLSGAYNDKLILIRKEFLHIASLLELEIDFSAEQEVFVDRKDLKTHLSSVCDMVDRLQKSFSEGNAFKEGIPIALVGKPNVGKSSLINAILGEQRSIVSSISGTTRDTIEQSIDYKGLNLRFIDTAGIRQTKNIIEKQGVERSFAAMDKALIIVAIFDSNKDTYLSIKRSIEKIKHQIDLSNKEFIVVINKSDISTLSDKDKDKLSVFDPIYISAKENIAIEDLLIKISSSWLNKDFLNNVFVSNIRHFEALKNCLSELKMALEALDNDYSSDLISENIRSATNYLGQITGQITSEDILKSIFSSFCIGK